MAEGRDAHGIVELALKEEFAGQTAVVSSFGSESAVLLHLVAEVDPNTPILFINTGKLFGETLRYRDRLQDELGLGAYPHARSASARPLGRLDPDGTLWARDTDACCSSPQSDPTIRRALEGFAACRSPKPQAVPDSRPFHDMQTVEHFEGRFRFNPLATWTLADLEAYTARHNLPHHPLVEDGYPSIGCMPCTRRTQAGEGYRDGRWSGLGKDECGIHGLDGDGI